MSSNVQIAKRTLGKTGIEVTPIGLGMMEFAGGGGLMGPAFPIIEQENKNATVKAGLDGGVNWFDTAELYGAGVSETSLAIALKAAGKKDDDVVVATKWWRCLALHATFPRPLEIACVFLTAIELV